MTEANERTATEYVNDIHKFKCAFQRIQGESALNGAILKTLINEISKRFWMPSIMSIWQWFEVIESTATEANADVEAVSKVLESLLDNSPAKLQRHLVNAYYALDNAENKKDTEYLFESYEDLVKMFQVSINDVDGSVASAHALSHQIGLSVISYATLLWMGVPIANASDTKPSDVKVEGEVIDVNVGGKLYSLRNEFAAKYMAQAIYTAHDRPNGTIFADISAVKGYFTRFNLIVINRLDRRTSLFGVSASGMYARTYEKLCNGQYKGVPDLKGYVIDAMNLKDSGLSNATVEAHYARFVRWVKKYKQHTPSPAE